MEQEIQDLKERVGYLENMLYHLMDTLHTNNIEELEGIKPALWAKMEHLEERADINYTDSLEKKK